MTAIDMRMTAKNVPVETVAAIVKALRGHDIDYTIVSVPTGEGDKL
jgi:hypothetical protein